MLYNKKIVLFRLCELLVGCRADGVICMLYETLCHYGFTDVIRGLGKWKISSVYHLQAYCKGESYGAFTPEQDNDKTNVEPVHFYYAFHTRSDKPGVKGIIEMHRFNFCLVVVLSLSCSGVKAP